MPTAGNPPVAARWLRSVRHFQLPLPRCRAAAIAVLSEEGYVALRRHGHARVATACQPAAASCVRFVDPSESQRLENASEAALARMLDAPGLDLPLVLAIDRPSAAQLRVQLRIPPDLRALRGHFPAMPIVPGVAQLRWAIEFAERELGTPARLARIDPVKFRRIVQPGHELALGLELTSRNGSCELRFTLSSRLGLHSAGRCVLEPGDA